MYEELFNEGDEGKITESFDRLESEEIDDLMGKRIKGKGKIESVNQAKGEMHPAVVTTDEGELIAAHELPFQDFDDRHTDLPF